MINERLNKLREEMKINNIDVYFMTTGDDHLSEYVSEYYQSIKYFSGFTGSLATFIIDLENAYLFVDGRYHLQAEKQCSKYGITKGSVSGDTKTYGVTINLYDKSLSNRFNCETGLIEFFKRNYLKVLGRNAEASGLDYWVKRVKTGQEHIGSAASNGFLHSNEFLGLNRNGSFKGNYKSNSENHSLPN